MIESIRKNGKGILLMIISSILVCFGQLFWKISTDFGLIWLLGGFVLYGFGAVIMIVAYKFGSLSVLQPILSLNYALSLLIGYYFLNEHISLLNMMGVVFILIGVLFIAGGD